MKKIILMITVMLSVNAYAGFAGRNATFKNTSKAALAVPAAVGVGTAVRNFAQPTVPSVTNHVIYQNAKTGKKYCCSKVNSDGTAEGCTENYEIGGNGGVGGHCTKQYTH